MNQAFQGGATVRAALLMTGSTYVTYVLTLLISALIARAIGPDDFGRYSYLVWLAGTLAMVANNGLNTTGIRFISECLGRGAVESAHQVHAWLIRRQWACMAGVTIVFIIVMPFFKPAGWEGDITTFAGLALVVMFTKGFYLFDISMAKGYGRFGIEAATTVIMSVVNLLITVALVLTGAPLIWFIGLFALVSGGHMASSTVMLRRAKLIPMAGDIEPTIRVRVRQHLIWTVVLTGVAVLSNRSIETWLLNTLVGPAEVGYFAIAAALTRGGVDLLSSGLTTVLMPAMAHAYGAGGQRGVNMILSDSFRYFQFLGFLLAGSGTLLAPVVVMLMYGPRYEPVVDVLRVMVVIGGLALSEGAFGAVLSTTDNQRLRAGFAIFSVSISAAAAFLLIPKYGLYGAILAHAISRTIVFVATMLGISRFMALQLPLREIGRLTMSALTAAVLAGGVSLAWPAWWVNLIASVLYAIVFVACTIVLRAWKSKDVWQLARLTARFPRLSVGVQARIERWAATLQDDEDKVENAS